VEVVGHFQDSMCADVHAVSREGMVNRLTQEGGKAASVVWVKKVSLN
jgi:hypothetical protein